MKHNRQYRINILADYILSQDHEREAVKDNMLANIRHISRDDLIEDAENSVYFHAMVLTIGTRKANAELKACYREALEIHKRQRSERARMPK